MTQIVSPVSIPSKKEYVSGYSYIPLICFVLFGLMISDSTFISYLIRIVSGGIYGLLYAKLMVMSVQWAGGIKEKSDIVKAQRGFLYCIPFVIMALTSRYLLGWGNIQVFVAPAVMGAAAGMCKSPSKKGSKIAILVLPLATSVTMFVLWNIMCHIMDRLEEWLK